MKQFEMDSKLTSVLIKSEAKRTSDKSDFKQSMAKDDKTFLEDEGYFDVCEGHCADEDYCSIQDKNLTYLVLAMPGSGKSTWCKSKNDGKAEHERPAIDFDYKGTRFRGGNKAMVALMQSYLFNEFHAAGVKYITTFVGSFIPTALECDSFKVIFVLPAKKDLHILVDRVKKRDVEGDGVFPKLYEQNASVWLDHWRHMCIMMKENLHMDVEYRRLKANQYLSDVLSDI